MPVEPAFDRQAKPDMQCIIAAKPPEVREAIRPQAPCVTIHARPGGFDQFSPWNRNLRKFVIPFQCQDTLAVELAADGITQDSVLFEDPEGFALGIAERHRSEVLDARRASG